MEGRQNGRIEWKCFQNGKSVIIADCNGWPVWASVVSATSAKLQGNTTCIDQLCIPDNVRGDIDICSADISADIGMGRCCSCASTSRYIRGVGAGAAGAATAAPLFSP